MIQCATLVTMDANTHIVLCKQIMTLKRCQSMTAKMLADGYKPVDEFTPTKNEAYTNGTYIRAWKFTGL